MKRLCHSVVLPIAILAVSVNAIAGDMDSVKRKYISEYKFCKSLKSNEAIGNCIRKLTIKRNKERMKGVSQFKKGSGGIYNQTIRKRRGEYDEYQSKALER